PLDDERGGAADNGVGREVVPIGPKTGNAGEEGAADDRARVVRQVGDVGRGRVDRPDRPDGLAERGEIYGAGFYQWGCALPAGGGAQKTLICGSFATNGDTRTRCPAID